MPFVVGLTVASVTQDTCLVCLACPTNPHNIVLSKGMLAYSAGDNLSSFMKTGNGMLAIVVCLLGDDFCELLRQW